MNDGFSGIADLTVEISTDIEKFRGGFGDAIKTVEQFSSQGAGFMKAFDGTIGGVVGGLSRFNAVIGGLTASVAVVHELAKGVLATVGELAEQTGTQQQFAELSKEADTLSEVLDNLQRTAFAAVAEGATSMALSLAGASPGSVAGAMKSVQEQSTKTLSAVGRLLDRLNAPVRMQTDTLRDEMNRLGETADVLNQRLTAARETQSSWRALERFLSGGANSQQEMLEGQIAAIRTQQLEVEELYRLRLRGAEADRRAAENAVDPDTRRAIDSLDQEAAGLERRARALTMNAAASARYLAEGRAMAAIAEANADVNDVERYAIDAKLDRIQAATRAIEAHNKAEKDRQGFARIVEQLRDETSAIKDKADALVGLNEKTHAQSVLARALQQLARGEITSTEARITELRGLAAEAGNAHAELTKIAEAMSFVQEHGQVVTRGLETAFSSWTRGADLDVKQMIASMLAEFAKLAFSRGLAQLGTSLMGDGSSGGSGIAALITAVFSGARADGGSVAAGRSYTVGERGPERFVPYQDGMIEPTEAAGRQSINVTVQQNINAAGAYPESIADIRRELALQNARLPSTIMSVVGEANDRGMM